MKKTISLMLVLVLLLGLFPVSVFAEGTPDISLAVSATTVGEGEEVTVTVNLENKIEALSFAEWFVYFDSALFERVSYTDGTAIPQTAISKKTSDLNPKNTEDQKYGDTFKKISISTFSLSDVSAEPGVVGTITFRALKSTTENEPAIFSIYTDMCQDQKYQDVVVSAPETPVKVSVTAKPIAVTGIELNQSILNLKVGESTTLTAAVSPENAADKTVTWSSSKTEIATVVDGQVTAVAAGTAVITAKAGDFSATCYVAVTKKEEEAGEYTVEMGKDTQVIAGETVSVPVTVGHTAEVKTYNAFDLSFSYDPTALELCSTELDGLTVTAETGTVRVQGYGADREVGSTPFELKFKAVGAGSASVTLTGAKVDISDHAIGQDAPDAKISRATTNIQVTGYPVTLPENFSGAAVAVPEKDYTFSIPDDYYDYKVTATVDGVMVTCLDNGDGTYTVPGTEVTGALIVSMERTGKTFTVTLATDLTGEQTAQYMTAYTATLNRKKGYAYQVSICIAGEPYTGFAVVNDQYIIPGEDITGDVVFTVEKTVIPVSEYTVQFEGTGAGDAVGANTVPAGSDYTFTVNKDEAYRYEITAVMGTEQTVTEITEADGQYTISNVTGNLVITVEKTAEFQVEVGKYVELDGKTVFLITVTGSEEQKKAYTYDGNAMFYSEVYQAWCYLTIEDGQFTQEDARAKIAMTETTFISLAPTTDVNMSGLKDINDAQLVYDIYNGKYEDFTAVSMQKFLNADVNGDKTVNVTDAAAVVAAIR